MVYHSVTWNYQLNNNYPDTYYLIKTKPKMKTLASIIICIFTYNAVFGQDIILLKTNEQIKTKVVQITATEVKYKNFDNQTGPTYTILKSDVVSVKYENGIEDVINTPVPVNNNNNINPQNSSTNLPKANQQMQNTGTPSSFKNKIGLRMGGGAGFKKIPVVTLNDGTTASISFGNGVLVQLDYLLVFGRHFDLEIGVGGQFGELDKTVSNGSVDFTRSILSFTPSYVIPLTPDDNMSLKLGAGIDYLYGAVLSIDLSKVPGGFKDDWSYNSSLGEHVSMVLMVNSSKRWTFTVGVQYRNASYTFGEGNSRTPSDPDMKNPNGSGVDFLLGGYYCFNWKKR
jgi:hypothetical protein